MKNLFDYLIGKRKEEESIFDDPEIKKLHLKLASFAKECRKEMEERLQENHITDQNKEPRQHDKK